MFLIIALNTYAATRNSRLKIHYVLDLLKAKTRWLYVVHIFTESVSFCTIFKDIFLRDRLHDQTD